MRFSRLSTVKHRVRVGAPLPFNVRDIDRTLLLARGQVVADHGQMEALLTRGALVDIAELLTPVETIRQAPAEALPGLWRDCLDAIGETLHQAVDEDFAGTLQAATPAVVTLIERDPDLSIFQMLRQDGNEWVRYGSAHSMHVGITAFLVARRLRWGEADIQRVFKAALTMNLSMLELQGQLAIQDTPITDEQREAVRAHPEFSVRMLELSGVEDVDWLRAVAQHHERPDGSGYPYGLHAANEMAELVRRADVYTTMLSPRRGRRPLPADTASRAMYARDPGHPMTDALVKEFGIYPPGCAVTLESGECGVVLRRGPTVLTPLVAVRISDSGPSLAEFELRDTSRAEHAIAGMAQRDIDLARIPVARLLALADGH